MMKKLLLSALISTALLGCEVATGIYSGLRGQTNTPPTSAQSTPQLTRAMVNESGLAMIRTTLNQTGWDYLIALSSQHGTNNFGQKGRVAISMRGGLVIGAYTLGNDLLGVKLNANDPVQMQRPYSQWSASYSRIYELPGEGVNGDQRKVECQHQALGAGSVEIIEHVHQTQLIEENCHGDELSFNNRYMVDDTGFIWKSEQWVGQNPVQLVLEIIEPLD